jgi:SAM-dependent methyltransferase
VLGVDFSDEAITFARRLSTDSGIRAEFEQAEVVGWMATTERRFDIAFTTYGTTGWLPDIGAWARGVQRILRPGGVLVYVEFHPLVWSIGRGPDPAVLDLSGDDYFCRAPFRDPVGDYVAESGAALGGVVEAAETVDNVIPATSWQRTLAEILQAVIDADLRLERVQEWPHSNGCRVVPGLVALDDRRWTWPPLAARVPLMFGVRAVRAR